jgi:hypothetical protein
MSTGNSHVVRFALERPSGPIMNYLYVVFNFTKDDVGVIKMSVGEFVNLIQDEFRREFIESSLFVLNAFDETIIDMITDLSLEIEFTKDTFKIAGKVYSCTNHILAISADREGERLTRYWDEY